MSTRRLPDLVQAYRALAHPTRIRILAMLRTGELCVCQITAVLGLAPSTVSAHLAELRRAGLITERKEGRWVHYGAAEPEGAAQIGEWLWQQLKRDAHVRRDAAVVKQLRTVPLAELCSADFELDQLVMARTA